MTFGLFSKSATNEPNMTIKILIAPRSGASGIAIVIFGSFVADFENGPNVIGTFWHFLKLLGTFCKKVWPHLVDPIWHFPNGDVSDYGFVKRLWKEHGPFKYVPYILPLIKRP